MRRKRLFFVRHEPISSYYRQAGANRIFFLRRGRNDRMERSEISLPGGNGYGCNQRQVKMSQAVSSSRILIPIKLTTTAVYSKFHPMWKFLISSKYCYRQINKRPHTELYDHQSTVTGQFFKMAEYGYQCLVLYNVKI